MTFEPRQNICTPSVIMEPFPHWVYVGVFAALLIVYGQYLHFLFADVITELVQTNGRLHLK